MIGALISFRTTRAHVPGRDLNRFLDREPVAVRTCARLRWRAHSDLTNAQTPPVTHRVAAFPTSGNVVASILPVWRKLVARKLERGGPLGALAFLATTFSRYNAGTCVRDLQIFAGSQVLTAGKCSFLRVAFVNDCRQPANRIARTFSFAPVSFLSSFALCHDPNMQHRSVQSHGKNHRNHG